MPGHKNLIIELHGYRFRIEGPIEVNITVKETEK